MAGVGQRGLDVSTRLSGHVTVREVDADDANVQDIVEILDTRIPEGVGEVPRGDHATLVLYAILDGGVTAAVISLYGYADDEESPFSSSSSSSSSSSPSSAGAAGAWCYYGDWAVDERNLMVVLPDMPASKYKVMVTGITGSGAVVIREQHSA